MGDLHHGGGRCSGGAPVLQAAQSGGTADDPVPHVAGLRGDTQRDDRGAEPRRGSVATRLRKLGIVDGLGDRLRPQGGEIAPDHLFPHRKGGTPMQSENRMFDDFVKMVNGFAGTFAGMGREAESSAREKFKEWMGGADFVGRDEFEAVKVMAAAARDENEVLKGRIAALEAKLAGKPKPGAAS